MTACWIDTAHGDTDFPLQNLPHGVFDAGEGARLGIAIGDQVLDVAGLDLGVDPDLLQCRNWNRFMAAGPVVWQRFRENLTALLTDAAARPSCKSRLHPLMDVRLLLPFDVTEFTDFYAGYYHAVNVGTLFRGADKALPENWLSIPVGYNGRASSVVVSGTPVSLPSGQIMRKGAELPVFVQTEAFDFELELGAVVGLPSNGPITTSQAQEMIFGYVLLNDWSARDIQRWEYQPLGPFQSKASATTISPWIVPRAALQPFFHPAPPRKRPLLEYLREDGGSHLNIELQVEMSNGTVGRVVSRTNARELYYSMAQQLCHHASCGCPMRTGDLIGSGTISGSGPDAYGSLLEITRNGTDPIDLGDGKPRDFLRHGDTICFSGAAVGAGYRIGFGTCEGTVVARGAN